MARKSFLLRMDPALLAALQQWSEEEMRSLNGQIEFLLRKAVLGRGIKLPDTTPAADKENAVDSDTSEARSTQV
ncbi:MAG TPA: hypothetical protein PKD72_13760 [Gemmatales bacterium]|nr:hypothetical protein [Gemmatales bacterium]